MDELRTFSIESDRVVIGAALPLTEMDRLWTSSARSSRVADTFGSPMIRNRATLGGNLGTASPIGDGAPLLLALDAMVHAAGPLGRRRSPIADSSAAIAIPFLHATRSSLPSNFPCRFPNARVL